MPDNEIPGVTRRQFLYMAAASGTALATASFASGAFAALTSGVTGPSPRGPRVPMAAMIMTPAGALTVAQRQAIVKGVTEVLVRVSGLGNAGRSRMVVLLSEVAEGGWGVGGHGYTKDELPGLVQGHKQN
jgi:4-oxalocrotonate tautomerase